MATNQRIYFALQSLSLSPMSSTAFTQAHGVQSLSINTKFNLEWAFEMGQLQVYQTIETTPDIEVTASKVLDGYPLLYHLATQGAPDASLAGRSNQRCGIAATFYGDTQSAASGVPTYQTTMSGMYVASVAYEFQVGSDSMENVTFVGNNKVWGSGSPFTASGAFGSDVPLAAEGINRREHFDVYNSVLPKSIPGVSASGTVDTNPLTGTFNCSVQSIKTSVSLGREPLYELGRKAPYFRYVSFPVPTKCDIEILAKTPDLITASEAGALGSGNNIYDETIFLRTREGTKITLGAKNKLSNVSYTGAQAGGRGGNATITYNYESQNIFQVVHPQDPTVGLAG